MKKEKFLLTVLTALLSLQLVIAQNSILDRSIEGLGNALGSIFTPIFGIGSTEFLFAKVLLFFLFFAIIFMSLGRAKLFEDNRAAHVVVTSVVSILAIRYLKEDTFIEAILLPYGALGIAIAIFLPLLIYFFFLHSNEIGGFGRRSGWFIYGAVFLVLWGSREYSTSEAANWIYGLGIGFVIISFIFDKSIHEYFNLFELEGSSKSHKKLERIDIKNEMKKVADAYKDGLIGKSEYNSVTKDLKRKYKSL